MSLPPRTGEGGACQSETASPPRSAADHAREAALAEVGVLTTVLLCLAPTDRQAAACVARAWRESARAARVHLASPRLTLRLGAPTRWATREGHEAKVVEGWAAPALAAALEAARGAALELDLRPIEPVEEGDDDEEEEEKEEEEEEEQAHRLRLAVGDPGWHPLSVVVAAAVAASPALRAVNLTRPRGVCGGSPWRTARFLHPSARWDGESEFDGGQAAELRSEHFWTVPELASLLALLPAGCTLTADAGVCPNRFSFYNTPPNHAGFTLAALEALAAAHEGTLHLSAAWLEVRAVVEATDEEEEEDGDADTRHAPGAVGDEKGEGDARHARARARAAAAAAAAAAAGEELRALRALCGSPPLAGVESLVLSFADSYFANSRYTELGAGDAAAAVLADAALAPLPALRRLHTLELRHASVFAVRALAGLLLLPPPSPVASPVATFPALRRLNVSLSHDAVGRDSSDSAAARGALVALAAALPPGLEVLCADLAGRAGLAAPQLVAAALLRCPALASLQLRAWRQRDDKWKLDPSADARIAHDVAAAAARAPAVRVSFKTYSLFRGRGTGDRFPPPPWRLS